jgi:predicted RNA-binding protein with RPS1 domain
MSAKIQKKYSVNATGELHINDDGLIAISNVDTGEVFDVAELLSDFEGKDVKISCNYAEDIA